MREIKFRGKVDDRRPSLEGQWVYGDFITGDQYGPYIRTITLEYIGVDEKTVDQFTGLKDSTGKEIYEGDIIASDYADYRALVAFCAGMFVATWGPNTAYQALYGVLRLKGLRVIGNIHDNSELLNEVRS